MSSGLVVVTERAPDGAPILDSSREETLAHVQPDVSLELGNSGCEEVGTLYITTRRVFWFSRESASHALSVEFPSISLHAICRDPEAYPKPCIYTQIDNGEEEDSDDEEEEDDEEDAMADGERGGAGARPPQAEAEGEQPQGSAVEANRGAGHSAWEDLSRVTEVRIIPSDPNAVDPLFKAFSDCALLNPDAGGVDREGEGEFFYDEDEVMGNVEGGADVARFDHLLEKDEERFEDAEDEDA